jgi:hypothetical protein
MIIWARIAAATLAFLSCTLPVLSFGQSAWGLRAGLNYSNLHFVDDSGFTRFGIFFSPMTAWHAGGFYRQGLGERLDLGAELLLNVVGAVETPGYPIDLETSRRELLYLSVPWLLSVQIWKGFAAHGGLQAGILLNGGEERYNNKAIELGWSLGLSKVFFRKYEIGVRYTQGLTPAGAEFFPGQDGEGKDNGFTVRAFNRNLQLTAAYYLRDSRRKANTGI